MTVEEWGMDNGNTSSEKSKNYNTVDVLEENGLT